MDKKTLLIAKIVVALIGIAVICVMIDAYKKGEPVVITKYSWHKTK